MKTPTAKTSGPFADPAHAGEIALMDKIGLSEFTELTGVGVGITGYTEWVRTAFHFGQTKASPISRRSNKTRFTKLRDS